MGKRQILDFPENVFEWNALFNDDYGFEPGKPGMPTTYPAGSPQKVAILRERVMRGQKLWHPQDPVIQFVDVAVDSDGWKTVGSVKSGAIVGRDISGARHRYAIWKELEGSGPALLYVPAKTGYADSWDDDEQLAAIECHAEKQRASFLAVAGLYTRRVASDLEFRRAEQLVTSMSLVALRWLARNCDRVVVCWGQAEQLNRNLDVLWLLSRTSRKCQIYAENRTGPPEPITWDSRGWLQRYDYRKALEGYQLDEDEEDSARDYADPTDRD
ncbi:MAG: DUF1643 domain-containing protein [bacterium]|nr:DUF1643 domain-containing protein [bacterium]